jgi:hypothetical protein
LIFIRMALIQAFNLLNEFNHFMINKASLIRVIYDW